MIDEMDMRVPRIGMSNGRQESCAARVAAAKHAFLLEYFMEVAFAAFLCAMYWGVLCPEEEFRTLQAFKVNGKNVF